MWIYSQTSGCLWTPEGKFISKGYSGAGRGKNNPKLDHVKRVGPIPRGMWVIGLPYDSERIGRFALPLIQHNHDAKGRSYFRIHGDSRSNPGKASLGCIILPRHIRKLIDDSENRLLMVIE